MSQDTFPKRIVLNGDTVNCYTDKQVRIFGKTIAKNKELSTENKLLKKQCDLYAERVKVLSGAVDSIHVQIISYREIIETKDTIINDLHTAVDLQGQDIKALQREAVRVKRKGNWKAVGFGIGGFSIGVGVGILIGVLR